MTRALAPIREDMTNLRADVNALADRVTGLDDRLKAVESSNSHIRRMAAVVECLIPSFYWVFTDEMQSWNNSRGSGRDARLEVVPFVSGEIPTSAPVCGLPCSLCNLELKKICLSMTYHLFVQ
jgi:hypothetical protein